jgi:hypothetical protein
MLGAALAACLGADVATASASAPLDPGVYAPRTDAPALAPARYHRWTCIARSRMAYGYGVAASRPAAARMALAQCAVRTRRGLVCVLTSCN